MDAQTRLEWSIVAVSGRLGTVSEAARSTTHTRPLPISGRSRLSNRFPRENALPELTQQELSVQALINDLKHVVDNVDPAQWSETARAVRSHHTPEISAALLSDSWIDTQQRAREIVDQMALLEDDQSLWNPDEIRGRVADLDASLRQPAQAASTSSSAHRPIFDLSDARQVTSPTFVPAAPRTRRSSPLGGLFSRRD